MLRKMLVMMPFVGSLAFATVASAHVDQPPAPKLDNRTTLKVVNKFQAKAGKPPIKLGTPWRKVQGRFVTYWKKTHPPRKHSHGYNGRYGPTPPAYVKQCESGGSYVALNSSSGASGAWQFLDSTWRAMGGTGKAMHASPAEQDMRAAKLWNYGAGASHWECA